MIKKFENPLFVTQPSLPKYELYVKIIKRIWDNKWISNNGPIHTEFEKSLKNYLQSNNITLFTNGHLALDIAIRSLNVKGEVITTPFTFVSTAHAISMNGLTPVFCDIKTIDYNIDEDSIESLINEKTTAILPVHVYGRPCNIIKIQELADKYNLKVIYDAAHAFGVQIDGTSIGDFGDISMFSFHATKVFNTIEGGALTYKDDLLKDKFNLLKNFGIKNEDEVSMVGLNAKMSEFQACMGILNLDNINNDIKKLKTLTELYFSNLSKIPGIIFNEIPNNIKYNYAYMPIIVDETKFSITRDELFKRFKEYNIFTRKYFYPLVSDTLAYSHIKSNTPNATYLSNRILCLPIFSDMTLKQVQKVCDIIKFISK
ncbi:MAG: DegT/DnrJ/EryC1/StrS family aminotransferase [Oscillospiraceae bacterium]|nr:DegT/DnrJ/EryC1/StrS family aminotransferase [Oscillospiraceae bacterium]